MCRDMPESYWNGSDAVMYDSRARAALLVRVGVDSLAPASAIVVLPAGIDTERQAAVGLPAQRDPTHSGSGRSGAVNC
jgi:hypothetical protein